MAVAEDDSMVNIRGLLAGAFEQGIFFDYRFSNSHTNYLGRRNYAPLADHEPSPACHEALR